jgi:hypothetical protein
VRQQDGLVAPARAAARGKRTSAQVAAFMLDPGPPLHELAQELRERTWQPGAARAFVVSEPKRRLIAALPFRDRVVQHLVVDAQLPAFERWFAPQSYACRTRKGTHRALRRACELHRGFPWLLRLDVAKFFASVDHELVLSLVRPRTPRELWWLTERIVRSGGPCERADFRFPGDDPLTPLERPHGLPIGNLTSQVWANAMLTPLDHLLGSGLGIGTFVRYCDDILVYGHRREQLLDAWKRIQDRCDRLRLRLHPRKCRLHRTLRACSTPHFASGPWPAPLPREAAGEVLTVLRSAHCFPPWSSPTPVPSVQPRATCPGKGLQGSPL